MQNGRPAWQRLKMLTVVIVYVTPGIIRAGETEPETILFDAHIYTVNERQPWAEALAVRSGVIVRVGSDAEINKLRGPNSRVIDAKGNLVLPGFTDCHIHFLDGSLSLLQVKLDEAKTIAEIQQTV